MEGALAGTVTGSGECRWLQSKRSGSGGAVDRVAALALLLVLVIEWHTRRRARHMTQCDTMLKRSAGVVCANGDGGAADRATVRVRWQTGAAELVAVVAGHSHSPPRSVCGRVPPLVLDLALCSPLLCFAL
jgi:hypothetical protein